MRRTTVLVFALLITAALAACSAAASASPSASSASPSAAASAAGAGASAGGGVAPQLVGTAWLLGDLPGQILPEARPTVAFSGDGTVSGFGGCNDISGTYSVDGSKLTFGPLATTRKACADPVNTIEQTYVAALQATQTYEITSDGKLKLTSPATTLTFAVQQ